MLTKKLVVTVRIEADSFAPSPNCLSPTMEARVQELLEAAIQQIAENPTVEKYLSLRWEGEDIIW